MNNRSQKGDCGFTLIELLVALAIFGLAIGTLMAAFGIGTAESRDSTVRSAALALASSLIESAKAKATILDGDTSGVGANGLQWRLHIAPYGDAADRDAWRAAPHILSAHISWTDGSKVKSLALTTIALCPKNVLP